MGYSISVAFKSKEARDRAFDLLSSSWDEIKAGHHSWRFLTPEKEDGLKYPPDTDLPLLGFNAQGEILSSDVCSFLALQSDYRQEGKPVMFLDDEAHLLEVGSYAPGKICITEDGFRLRSEDKGFTRIGAALLGLSGERKDTQKVIALLNEVWAEENSISPHSTQNIAYVDRHSPF